MHPALHVLMILLSSHLTHGLRLTWIFPVARRDLRPNRGFHKSGGAKDNRYTHH
jgi:hypothetical protein